MSAEQNFPLRRLDRRTVIKWMLTAAASAALVNLEASAAGSEPSGTGYGQDPDLLKDYKPGELWPLTFAPHERRTAAALCDVIIPADGANPAASVVGVHDFIDEWISAPYAAQQAERPIILEGIAWLDEESQRRHQSVFCQLTDEQKIAICDDVCLVAKAEARLKKGAEFFRTFRDLTAGGYYTTPQGMQDIGYRGNMPLATFEGPPTEVLKQLGLA